MNLESINYMREENTFMDILPILGHLRIKQQHHAG